MLGKGGAHLNLALVLLVAALGSLLGAVDAALDHLKIGEYQLKVDGKEYYILSFGPDGLEGTEDDIRSDRLSAKKDEE